jgi:Flp pilus assembly protein CpaB
MSRRARAAAFAAAALGCAALAAGLAGGYRADLTAQLGQLVPVVVTTGPLHAHRELRPQDVARLLDVRRIPARFVPPGALSVPAEAIARAPLATLPAGSYVTASSLAVPRAERPARAQALGPGRRPVEIAVADAGALATDGRGRRRVDVVVTTEPGPGGGAGRTYIAAEGVRLLDLRSGGAGSAGLPGADPSSWVATLALTRSQALRLIQAESFARAVRLIAR